MTNDVYAQVGYVMLMGLAARNAILIVDLPCIGEPKASRRSTR